MTMEFSILSGTKKVLNGTSDGVYKRGIKEQYPAWQQAWYDILKYAMRNRELVGGPNGVSDVWDLYIEFYWSFKFWTSHYAWSDEYNEYDLSSYLIVDDDSPKSYIMGNIKRHLWGMFNKASTTSMKMMEEAGYHACVNSIFNVRFWYEHGLFRKDYDINGERIETMYQIFIDRIKKIIKDRLGIEYPDVL